MRAVRGLRGEHPLELLLWVSGMSRSTYYHRAGSLRRREKGRREDALIAEAFAGSGGVVRSMSGRGSCYDNAVIESHFGNLKGRLGRLDRVPADKAAEMIDEAVRYFNEERILLKLGGLSPAEFLREYEKRRKNGRQSAADI